MRTQVYKQPRSTVGRLSDKSLELKKQKASACIVVEFIDGNTRRFWSDEDKRPDKIKTINQALAPFWELFRGKWHGRVKKAGIFDVRETNSLSGYNKIYQFEDGVWSKIREY